MMRIIIRRVYQCGVICTMLCSVVFMTAFDPVNYQYHYCNQYQKLLYPVNDHYMRLYNGEITRIYNTNVPPSWKKPVMTMANRVRYDIQKAYYHSNSIDSMWVHLDNIYTNVTALDSQLQMFMNTIEYITHEYYNNNRLSSSEYDRYYKGNIARRERVSRHIDNVYASIYSCAINSVLNRWRG